MKDRILSLLGTINKGIYEKETELSLSLMAALAGESVILLGPPGVAQQTEGRGQIRAQHGGLSADG